MDQGSRCSLEMQTNALSCRQVRNRADALRYTDTHASAFTHGILVATCWLSAPAGACSLRKTTRCRTVRSHKSNQPPPRVHVLRSRTPAAYASCATDSALVLATFAPICVIATESVRVASSRRRDSSSQVSRSSLACARPVPRPRSRAHQSLVDACACEGGVVV